MLTSIERVGLARYDGVADWYERDFAESELGVATRQIVVELLGTANGRLLDVGCGGGSHAAAFAELGWEVTGVDVSEDQLRLARARGVDALLGRAEELPFGEASFDAAVSMWTHTDIDDFPAAAHEVARVLRSGAPFVYLGVHPCFVGPHSRNVGALGIPELHAGYRETARCTEAPGITPEGLRARVGVSHLPLATLVQAFLQAGFVVERFEEPGEREYPYRLAMRWRK